MSVPRNLHASNPFRRRAVCSAVNEIEEEASGSFRERHNHSPPPVEDHPIKATSSSNINLPDRSKPTKGGRITSPVSDGTISALGSDWKALESPASFNFYASQKREQEIYNVQLPHHPEGNSDNGTRAASINPFGNETGSENDSPFSADEDEGSGAEEKSWQGTASSSSTPKVHIGESSHVTSTTSANPFRMAKRRESETDADRKRFADSQAKIVPSFDHQNSPRSPGGTTSRRPGRGAMLDVDAFKRLLLTGDSQVAATSEPIGSPSPPATHSYQDNPKSIVDRYVGLSMLPSAILTPRKVPSPTISREVREDLGGGTHDPARIGQTDSVWKTHTLPKGRYSAPIGSKDHSHSLSSTSAQTSILRTPPGTPMSTRSRTSSSPRSPRDLNKPLPPPPDSTSPERSGATFIRSNENFPPGEDFLSGSPSFMTSQTRRLPPKPPTGRRQSQLSSSFALTNHLLLPHTGSTSMLVAREDHFDCFTSSPRQIISTISTTSKLSPTPPPTRRPSAHRQTTSSSSSSIPTISTSPFATSFSPHTISATSSSASSLLTKAFEPLPSVKRPISSSSLPHSIPPPPPPPPPPPRRRRGNSKTSVEDTADTSTTPSILPLPTNPRPTGDGHESREKADVDVMKQMKWLKQEVDDLRAMLGS